MDRRLKAAALIFSVLLVFTGLADAQIWGRAPNAGARDRDRGYQVGYNEGVQRGRQDVARGVRYNYRTAQYDRGGAGFWGSNSNGQYKNAFREGYRAGYDAGYRERGGVRGEYGTGGYGAGGYGVPRNNGPIYGGPVGQGPGYGGYGGGAYGGGAYGNVSQIARDNGYREGLNKGQNDARQGKNFDLNRHDAYKDGDQGYRNEYGNKSSYKQEYRAGFMQGYQQGFGNRGTYGRR